MDAPEGPFAKLPADMWGEIDRFLGQQDFIEEQVRLARTSKTLYALFGGYVFVPDQAALDKALQHTGEIKAIVLLPEARGLRMERVPAATGPGGEPAPVVSYGSNTAITSGYLLVRGGPEVSVTVSDGGTVSAYDSVTVTALGGKVSASNAVTVNASGGQVQTGIPVYGGGPVTVNASGTALVRVWPNTGAIITASGSARVLAGDSATVTGHGPDVVIFWHGDPHSGTLHADPATIRHITEEDGRRPWVDLNPMFTWLEAKYPAPTPKHKAEDENEAPEPKRQKLTHGAPDTDDPMGEHIPAEATPAGPEATPAPEPHSQVVLSSLLQAHRDELIDLRDASSGDVLPDEDGNFPLVIPISSLLDAFGDADVQWDETGQVWRTATLPIPADWQVPNTFRNARLFIRLAERGGNLQIALGQ